MTIDLDPDARTCSCGSTGCFEEYFGARGILRTTRDFLERTSVCESSPTLSRLKESVDRLRPEDVSGIMSESDPAIAELRKTLARHCAIGISALVNIVNPDLIIIGGGIGRGFYDCEVFASEVSDLLDHFCLRACKERLRIRRSELDEGSVLGAGTLGITGVTL